MERVNQNGFTLIETLVAVIVLSISIVIIMQLFSSNLKSLPSSDLHLKAVLYARAKMEEILLFDSFMPGQSSGVFDDNFSWTVIIFKEEPEASETQKEKPISLFNLFRIDLEIFWKNGSKEKSYQVSALTSRVK